MVVFSQGGKGGAQVEALAIDAMNLQKRYNFYDLQSVCEQYLKNGEEFEKVSSGKL